MELIMQPINHINQGSDFGMKTIAEIAMLRQALGPARREGKSIGLVPTMGAFHEGHLTLMRRARAENDVVVVTLFVNPTQFNDHEDFEKYPRDMARDTTVADAEGVDYLFTPAPEEVYPKGFDTSVVVRGLSERLEGKSRHGHFAGVSTVVTKLLHIIQGERAYFGEKDWQQLQVVKRLVADLNIPTEIVAMPTVREPDGLAMSSRNARLTPEQRQAAAVLDKALESVWLKAARGVHSVHKLADRLHDAITVERLAKIDYAVVVDAETMQDIHTTEHGAIAAVAATFGKVRLIDNRYIPPSDGAEARK
jgi:pantoate--beta-alanine ligase